MPQRRALLLAVGLLWGCLGPAGADPARQAPRPKSLPRVDVQLANELTIYDVLERDESAVALVAVKRRALAPGVDSELAPEPSGPTMPYRRITVCRGSACADGLVARSEVAIAPPRNPCMGTTERVDDLVAVHSEPCEFLVSPELVADEREALEGEDGAPGSWLERGISLARADDALVSLVVGTAWLTAGAAHSNATLECRTLDASGEPRSLDGVFGTKTADAMIRAVNAHLLEQRELDEAASALRPLETDPRALRDFLVEGPPGSPTAAHLCFGPVRDRADAAIQLVRARPTGPTR